jgi:hypothetical protein
MNSRHVIPALVSLVSLAVVAWGLTNPSVAHNLAFAIIGLIGYVVSTDWLLLSLRDVPAPNRRGGKGLLIALKLAIGAPTGGLLLALTIYAAIKGDLAWEGPQYAFIPFVFVWPFVLAALTGNDGAPARKPG